MEWELVFPTWHGPLTFSFFICFYYLVFLQLSSVRVQRHQPGARPHVVAVQQRRLPGNEDQVLVRIPGDSVRGPAGLGEAPVKEERGPEQNFQEKR